jgi:P-type conjugative transfer protein TrbJ
MLKQGMSLPSSMFNNLTGDLQQLQSLYQQSRALSGNLSNFDSQCPSSGHLAQMVAQRRGDRASSGVDV